MGSRAEDLPLDDTLPECHRAGDPPHVCPMTFASADRRTCHDVSRVTRAGRAVQDV